MVLAHEAGQLLADHSHTPTGLMHASYMGASPQSWISHRTRRPHPYDAGELTHAQGLT
jgi:hypothetical protein